jgi:hypothetical protein
VFVVHVDPQMFYYKTVADRRTRSVAPVQSYIASPLNSSCCESNKKKKKTNEIIKTIHPGFRFETNRRTFYLVDNLDRIVFSLYVSPRCAIDIRTELVRIFNYITLTNGSTRQPITSRERHVLLLRRRVSRADRAATRTG